MSHFRSVELSDPSVAFDGLTFATVKSPALRQRADLCLWVAPGLEAGARAPLIVLLHGAYGSHWAWALKGRAHLTTARLILEGALPPVVLAMPSDGLWGDGSGYVPHRDQDFERWLIDDVPRAAAEITGMCDADAPFLIGGLSMGGFAAMRLAGKYPERIAAAAAHSAVTKACTLDPLIVEGRDGWSDAPEDDNVLAALLCATRPTPPIYFDCGRDDALLSDNRALRTAFDMCEIPHQYRETDGGHDWAYWTRALEHSLRFFGTCLAAQTPADGKFAA